jgi:5-formyltetrahydrofolate cyclo-ligase
MSQIEIRKLLRSRRNALSTEQQVEHEQYACHQFLQLLKGTSKKNLKIGLFLSFDSELSTQLLINQLWTQPQVRVYLPVIETRDNLAMAFAQYQEHTPMKQNKFNITEPNIDICDHVEGMDLDIVITPLVGFDESGHRLGMGGGYYDRCFAEKRQAPLKTPLMIGWAHQCQAHTDIQVEKWDVNLDGVITEKGLKIFNHPLFSEVFEL